MMIEWSGILTHAVWAATGGTGLYFWRRFHNWRRSLGHGALFAGLEDHTLFVFPSRPGIDRLLPHTAIEDFLAVNNIISAYLRVAKQPPDRMRDHDHLQDAERKNNNLILILQQQVEQGHTRGDRHIARQKQTLG